MANETLTVTDNRTGKTYEVPITDGTVRAMDLRQIKTGADDFGLMTYDPAFTNTASCQSAVTYIDGDKGILRYRGYPIEQLAENCTFLESAYLLLHGELPDATQLEGVERTRSSATRWCTRTSRSSWTGFHYDAHPMGMLIEHGGGAVHVLSGRARMFDDPKARHEQIVRLIAQDADDRGVRLPAPARAALRLSRQRPELHRRTS